MSLTALTFLLVFTIGAVLTVFKRPVFGLYTYIFVFYFNPPGKWWGYQIPSISWLSLIAVLTIVAILLKGHKEKINFIKFTENKIFIVYVLWVLFQYYFALNIEWHLFYMELIIKFYLAIFIIQNAIKNPNDVIVFIVINLICTAYFGYQGMGKARLEHIGVPGLDGSNTLAQHFAAILVMSSFLLLHPFGKKILLLIPFLVLTLNSVILTESRTVMISILMIGIIAAVLITKKSKTKFYFYGLLAIFALSVLVGESMLSKFGTISGDSNSDVQQDKSAESRLVIMEAQWEMFKDNPLLGYGHKGTFLLSPHYIPEEYLPPTRASGRTPRRSSHSLLFALLVDHGLLGALLYYSIIMVCFSRLMKIKRSAIEDETQELLKILLMGLNFALMTVIIAGMGSNNKVLEIDIWLIALIPVVYEMYRKNRQNSNSPALESNK